jgi:hypothetical protein
MVLLDWPPPDHLGIGRKSCQFLPAQAKEEERRERYIGAVTALYDRRRDIAPVAMTATLEPGTRAKTPQISPIPCSAARRPLGRSRRAMHVSQTQNGDVEKHPPAPKGAHHYRSKASAQEQASRPSFDTNPI